MLRCRCDCRWKKPTIDNNRIRSPLGPDLSVIIPTLNAQDCLPALLSDLNAQKEVRLETIVADGGSTDRTLERCRPFEPTIVRAPRKRASQLKAGLNPPRGKPRGIFTVRMNIYFQFAR